MDPSQTNCPKCHAIISSGSNYCSNCGVPVSDKALHISIGRQLWIYFVSICLPPLGLGYTFKYIVSPSSQNKRVAIIAAILTIVSIVLTIWATMGLINSLQTQLNSQLNSYPGMGL